MKPDEIDISIISIYPGSEYFNKSILENGQLKYSSNITNENLYIKNIDFLEESNFYKSKSDEYVSYVSTETLSYEDIVIQRELMEKEIKKL